MSCVIGSLLLYSALLKLFEVPEEVLDLHENRGALRYPSASE